MPRKIPEEENEEGGVRRTGVTGVTPLDRIMMKITENRLASTQQENKELREKVESMKARLSYQSRYIYEMETLNDYASGREVKYLEQITKLKNRISELEAPASEKGRSKRMRTDACPDAHVAPITPVKSEV